MKLSRRRGPDCPSDYALDALLAGEPAASTRTHLSTCAECTGRLERIESDRQTFRDGAPVLRGRRAQPAVGLGHRVRQWLIPGGALVAAVAVLLLWLRAPATSEHEGAEVTRSKGGVSLGFYVKRNGMVTRGIDGAPLHGNDAIRFTYTSKQASHLVIASRDGAGAISVYYADGDSSAAAPAGADVAISESVLLDNALGPELVYGFFCAERTSVSAITQAIGAAQGAPSLDACSVAALRWMKVAR